MSWIYYSATTLDGFLADPDDSLEWLFRQQDDPDVQSYYERFIGGVGAVVMGATTYSWVTDHLRGSGEAWPYEVPSFVFTHRELEPVAENVRFVSGEVTAVADEIMSSAAGADVWVAGGGDLAGQVAEAGLLDRVAVSIAAVTLGAGRPLFPRRRDLRLVEVERDGDFILAVYDDAGPLTEDRPT